MEWKYLKPKSAQEIYEDLEASRKSYENGEYQDFDDAIDKISQKYNLDDEYV